MSRSLGVLTLDLIVKTSGFVEGLSKAEKAAAKESAKMQKDLEKLTKAGLAVGAAFVAGSIAMVASSIKMADESKKAAQAAGLTTEAFTKLSWAAQQSGLSQEQLSVSMRSLNNGMVDAAKGTGTAAAAYKQLGVDVVNADGSLRQGEAVLLDIANAFEAMPDGAQKSAIAIDLLGKSGAAMIPLLNGGAKGLNELTTQAERLGLVFSEDTANQAELFNDSLAVVTSVARGASNEVAANLLPVLSEVAESFAHAAEEGEWAKDIAGLLTVAFQAVAQVGLTVAYGFEKVALGLAGLVSIAASVPDGFDAISQAAIIAGEEINNAGKAYEENLKKIDAMTAQTSGFNPAKIEATGGGFVPVAGASTTADTSKQDKLNADIEALKESFMTEEELLLQKFETEQMLLGEFYAGKEELTQEWQDLSLQSAQRYQESLKAIEKAGFVERSKMTQQALSNLSTLMNGQSRKLFEVGKAAAIANAVISGHEAAVEAYKGGLKVSGGIPAVGAAFAAASLAATGVQIQAINSTSFGGGKSGTSNTQAVNNASVGTGGAGGGQAAPDRNIFIRGINKDSLYSGEQFLDLINNELANGGRLIAV